MRTVNKTLYFLALLALLCVPLVVGLANGPYVVNGFDPDADLYAAVRYRNFNSSGKNIYEVIIGKPGFPSGSLKSDITWKGSNNITFRYDKSNGKIESIANGSTLGFEIGDLGAINSINIHIEQKTGNTMVRFSQVKLNGEELGSFSIAPGIKMWMVTGVDLSDGFTLEGFLELEGSQPGADQNLLEISVGYSPPPLITVVNIDPQPLYLNELALISAFIDHSSFNGDNISAAEYNLDSGIWKVMEAKDGSFDEASEEVETSFPADIIGGHTGCVRGYDAFLNISEEECQIFLVDYIFEGFFDPIDNNMINESKAGQVIPVKWRLTDALGAPIDDPSSFTRLLSQEIACQDGVILSDPIEEYATGDSGLQYLSDGYWQYNWKTSKLYSGMCRNLYVEFKSTSSSPVIIFKFK